MYRVKDYINIDKEILSGNPVFRGTRVPIQTLFQPLLVLRGGMREVHQQEGMHNVAMERGGHSMLVKNREKSYRIKPELLMILPT